MDEKRRAMVLGYVSAGALSSCAVAPRMTRGALPTPPNAGAPDSVEILRVWAQLGVAQQVTLNVTWKDEAAWGLLLADVARHAAKAYAASGYDEQQVLARIRKVFDLEMAHPTDLPLQINAKPD